MWLKDANYSKTSGYDGDGVMTWADTNDWITSLNSASYLGYNDWRLPDTNPVNSISYNYILTFDGSSDRAYNVSAPGSVYPNSTGGEMAYIYHVELGNLGKYDTSGNVRPGIQGADWGLTNTAPFTNLKPYWYWSGTEYAPNNDSWAFGFDRGGQFEASKNNIFNAWAVRDAESTTVPEPTTIALLGIGLVAFAGAAVRRRLKMVRKEGV